MIASRVAEKGYKKGRDEGLESRLNDLKKLVEVSDLVSGGRRRGTLDLSAVLDGFVNSGALKEIMAALGPSLPESGHASSEQQSPPGCIGTGDST